jgi:hypothetical protein
MLGAQMDADIGQHLPRILVKLAIVTVLLAKRRQANMQCCTVGVQ